VASVHLQPKSNFYVAAWRDHEGRQHRRSTRETNKRRALEVARLFEAATRKYKSREHAWRTLRQLFNALYGDDCAETSLRQYAEQWLKSKEPSVSAGTIAFYKGATQTLLNWLGKKADRSLRELSKQDIIDYRSELASKLSTCTANHHMVCCG
jgi:hypothetical protein